MKKSTLVQSENKTNGKHADSLVDGRKTEFKTVTGNIRTVGSNYKKALKQGDDIFIRTSNKNIHDIYSKIIGETKTVLQHGIKLDENRQIYIWLDNEKILYEWTLKEIIEKCK